MSIENLLRFGIEMLRKNPKLALPNVLNWVPSALLSVIILQAANSVDAMIGSMTLEQMVLDMALIWSIVTSLLVYAVIAVPVVVASWVINLFLSCVYSDLARQSYAKKKVMISQAFSVGKSRLRSMIWTSFLEFLILSLVAAVLLGIGLLGGVIGVMISGIISFIIILFSFIFFYETSAVVVIENKSGIDAIKRSYSISRQGFGRMSFLILIVGFATSMVSNLLGGVTFIGTVLVYVVGIFLSAWGLVVPAAFYYEYAKKD